MIPFTIVVALRTSADHVSAEPTRRGAFKPSADGSGTHRSPKRLTGLTLLTPVGLKVPRIKYHAKSSVRAGLH